MRRILSGDIIDFLKICGSIIILLFYLVIINAWITDGNVSYVMLGIEIGSIIALIFIIFTIGFFVDRHKKKYCKHHQKRSECAECIGEEKQRQLEIEKRNNYRTIKKKIEKVNFEEANRLNRLKHLRTTELYELTPNEFEDAIAHLFTELGYSVQQTPYSNDGGKDAIAFKDGNKFLIECKRYALGRNIGRPHLQKFHAAIIEEKAITGYYVTTSSFTSTSIDYAKKFNIELIDADKLSEMFNEAFPDAINSLSFRQVCPECGEIIEFIFFDEITVVKNCINSHEVFRKVPILPENDRPHMRI